MGSEHLRFAPDILRRLGEELIPHPEQGLVELVRNAYDADAEKCAVELCATEKVGGSVVVRDDGIGMTLSDILAGWLVIGRSRKASRQPTERGRLPVGDKGLGRLAALRMGSSAVLETRPKEEPGTEFQVSIDWSTFDMAETVEAVPINVTERQTGKRPGTTITIEGLGQRLGRREADRLARALVLLSDPFSGDGDFKVTLVAPGFADLERKVRKGYLDNAAFHLTARLDDAGRAQAQVCDWKGQILWTAGHERLRGRATRDPYAAPAVTFELWAFLLEGKAFSKRSASLGEVRGWLGEVGGVHLYHRGLRVYPYGDKGHDWLDMNLARSRNPELRPSTNTSVGRVIVLDEEQRLLQKTDRTGFVENDAFANLRQFAVDALEWMAKERLRAREATRERERAAVPKAAKRAKETFDQVLSRLPTSSRSAVEGAVLQLERIREKESRVLRREVELYRTLSTVGTTVAVFAHESSKPVSQIEKMARVIEERGKAALGEKYAEGLEKPVSIIQRSALALKTFASVPIKLLESSKRQSTRASVHEVINDTVALFQAFLDDAKIRATREFVDHDTTVRGTAAAVQAVIANLLTNAINAFNSKGARLGERMIVFRTEIARDRLLLRVLDNGPGITDMSVDDIWLPGYTTTPGGTGLGLSIVRDTVADLDGRATAVAKGDLGGAEFVVDLPLIEGET